ncbi:MAG: gamma-glutamylcyclotransferase [Rhodobacteraceae bacterium]|nr:gamma-glutamylcyclotransferase [Paracoccaceae bacterium]
MADPFFFGYGSLVNRATHTFPQVNRANITGWRRGWRHTDLRDAAFLTAIPDINTTIQGLIAHVPNDDWVALDKREWAYDRVPVTSAVAHPIARDLDIAVYAVPAERQSHPSTKHPILLSYLDVVVQGYLQEFGEDGARQFFETTDGWDIPVLNDRKSPRYVRHQTLTANQTAFVDRHLAQYTEHIMLID